MNSNRSTAAVADGYGSSYGGAVAAPAGRDVAALVGRILLAGMFVLSGFGKITAFSGTAGYIASKGLPFPELLAAAAIVIELGGGLAVLAGWKTRWVALVM